MIIRENVLNEVTVEGVKSLGEKCEESQQVQPSVKIQSVVMGGAAIGL